jgi:trimethylamine:corrinoid methyltransferase-like protein
VLDEIKQIGPGGNFLISETTLKSFRQAYYQSEVFGTLTLEEWQAQGCPQADDKLRQHTNRLLARLGPLDDHAELIGRGEDHILK